MKKRTASRHAPGACMPTDAPKPLSNLVSVPVTLDVLETVYPAHQKYLVEKLFVATRKHIPPVALGPETSGVTGPDSTKLVCDNGQLGSLDHLLHLIETWQSARHAAVLGRRMNCKRSPTTRQADTGGRAPLP